MAIVFTAIRVLLGFFFTIAGVVKLTDQVSAEVYQHMIWLDSLAICERPVFDICDSILSIFIPLSIARLSPPVSAGLIILSSPSMRKSQFVQFADVFPLKDFGFKPDPYQYLQVVGWIELVAGILLTFGPRVLQEISNLVLCIVMIGAIYTLIVLKEPIAMCAPATVCLGLLLLLNIRGHGKKSKSKAE